MLFVPLRMLCKPAAEVDYDGHGYKPEENTWGIFDGNFYGSVKPLPWSF